MTARLDITGQNFGPLTGIKFLASTHGEAYWLFRCECGTFVSRSAKAVKYAQSRGKIVSCGCLLQGIRSLNGMHNATHGLSSHKLYDVHRQMLRRCFDERCKDYSSYGERSITVCDAWMDLATFIAWAEGSGYRDGLTIERIDVNGDYDPDNCTWIVNEKQAHNTRRLKKLTLHGETKFISDWARETGISRNTIHSRLRHGWSIEATLTTPVKTMSQVAA